MKLYQKDRQYNPITIELDNENEARAFLNIVDICDGSIFPPDSEEGKLLKIISDAFTNQDLIIP